MDTWFFRTLEMNFHNFFFGRMLSGTGVVFRKVHFSALLNGN